MRLDKFVSYCLDISRVDAKKIIKNKEIEINDVVITDSAYLVKLDKDIVKYQDKILKYEEYIYLMLNKPTGYICATTDPNPTVLDLITEYKKYNLSIVGRLDKDSVGLLLLTNDGKLNHFLTSPKSSIYKKYYVEVDGEFNNSDIEEFKNGITITDVDGSLFKTSSSILEIISKNRAYISIKEGKFHQVKKMCEKVGKTVTYLKRVQIGLLKLDPSLKEGMYRKLTSEEINYLISLTKSRWW